MIFRLIINDCLDSGTQIPFIKRAKDEDYGVIVLNTNDNHRVIDSKRVPIRVSVLSGLRCLVVDLCLYVEVCVVDRVVSGQSITFDMSGTTSSRTPRRGMLHSLCTAMAGQLSSISRCIASIR